MKKVIFIVQQMSQPRCIKRIESFVQNNIEVKVYGFDSGLYNGALKNLIFPVEKIIKRNKEDNKLKKIFYFIKQVNMILKSSSHDDIIYLFGFELCTIARFLGCKNYVYEEADVSAARFANKYIRSLLLYLDRCNINNSLFTVFTSGGFMKYIFGKKIVKKDIIILPNKLSPYFLTQKRPIVKFNIDVNHINFGFVGLIRYPNTIVRFAKVVGKFFPNHNFHFYGDPEKESYLDEELKSYPNVFVHGNFINPIDLERIYSNIDVNVVCYDTNSDNVCIAEPNKLYESIYFLTPIVVSSKTYLSERVKDLEVGYSIDASSDEGIIDFIKTINADSINKCIFHSQTIKSAEVIDSVDDLMNLILKHLR